MDDKWMMNEVGLHLTQNSKSIETNLLLVAFLPQQRSTWDGSSNDGRLISVYEAIILQSCDFMFPLRNPFSFMLFTKPGH